MMDCRTVRENLHASIRGGIDANEASTVAAHLETCPPCTQEFQNLQDTLSLLQSLEEIAPSNEIWHRIAARLRPGEPRRAGVWRFGLMSAVAASLLTAILSFILLWTSVQKEVAYVSYAAPGTNAFLAGQRLEAGRVYHAPSYTLLTLPEVGILRIHPDSSFLIEGRRRVALREGQIFAEVAGGFTLTVGQIRAGVMGTRFGVSRTHLYVLEGAVEVTNPQGRVLVESDQAVGFLPENSPHLLPEPAAEYARWLAAYENIRPELALRLNPETAGQGISCTLVLSNPSPIPLFLDPLSQASQFLILRITGADESTYTLHLENSMIYSIAAHETSHNQILLDARHPCEIQAVLDPKIFPKPGFFRVAAVYTSGHPARSTERGLWMGIVETRLPVPIEIPP